MPVPAVLFLFLSAMHMPVVAQSPPPPPPVVPSGGYNGFIEQVCCAPHTAKPLMLSLASHCDMLTSNDTALPRGVVASHSCKITHAAADVLECLQPHEQRQRLSGRLSKLCKSYTKLHVPYSQLDIQPHARLLEYGCKLLSPHSLAAAQVTASLVLAYRLQHLHCSPAFVVVVSKLVCSVNHLS